MIQHHNSWHILPLIRWFESFSVFFLFNAWAHVCIIIFCDDHDLKFSIRNAVVFCVAMHELWTYWQRGHWKRKVLRTHGRERNIRSFSFSLSFHNKLKIISLLLLSLSAINEKLTGIDFVDSLDRKMKVF